MLPNREPAREVFRSAPMSGVLSNAFQSLTGVSLEQASVTLQIVGGVQIAMVAETVRIEKAVIDSGKIALAQVVEPDLGVILVARKEYSILQVLDQRLRTESGLVVPIFKYEHLGFNEDGDFVDQDPVYKARMTRLPKHYGKDSVEARIYDIAHETIVAGYDELEGHRRSFFYID